MGGSSRCEVPWVDERIHGYAGGLVGRWDVPQYVGGFTGRIHGQLGGSTRRWKGTHNYRLVLMVCGRFYWQVVGTTGKWEVHWANGRLYW